MNSFQKTSTAARPRSARECAAGGSFVIAGSLALGAGVGTGHALLTAGVLCLCGIAVVVRRSRTGRLITGTTQAPLLSPATWNFLKLRSLNQAKSSYIKPLFSIPLEKYKKILSKPPDLSILFYISFPGPCGHAER
ncbi:MAG TPA: hypothetical protein VG796_01315 [Verrucomicrobiales bacterium]|nr:hypothetical protein [Verrucomicrobiales bacterium]